MEQQEHQNQLFNNDLYQDPQKYFQETISSLPIPRNQRSVLFAYIEQGLNGNPKDPQLQTLMKQLLEYLVENGEKEAAQKLFNIHRIITEFRGYSPNDDASSDVDSCFGPEFKIPEFGAIVVRGFLFRNLPKIIKICKDRGVDLSRIRAIETQSFFVTQLLKLSPEKRTEFEEACKELNEDQFIIKDYDHVGDIPVYELKAIDFFPRIAPIYTKLNKGEEKQTAKAYRNWFRRQLLDVVEGGRVFAHSALTPDGEYQELAVETAENGQTKLTGAISNQVAVEILRAAGEERFLRLEEGEFLGLDRDPKLDHSKMVKSFHLQKRSNFLKTALRKTGRTISNITSSIWNKIVDGVF